MRFTIATISSLVGAVDVLAAVAKILLMISNSRETDRCKRDSWSKLNCSSAELVRHCFTTLAVVGKQITWLNLVNASFRNVFEVFSTYPEKPCTALEIRNECVLHKLGAFYDIKVKTSIKFTFRSALKCSPSRVVKSFQKIWTILASQDGPIRQTAWHDVWISHFCQHSLQMPHLNATHVQAIHQFVHSRP